MPTLLLSFKRVPGSSGLILHGFLAPNDTTAEKMKAGHAAICPQYGPAVKADETIDELIEVEEIPEFDDVAIAEWVADMFSLEDDDGDTEEEEEEDDDKGGEG